MPDTPTVKKRQFGHRGWSRLDSQHQLASCGRGAENLHATLDDQEDAGARLPLPEEGLIRRESSLHRALGEYLHLGFAEGRKERNLRESCSFRRQASIVLRDAVRMHRYRWALPSRRPSRRGPQPWPVFRASSGAKLPHQFARSSSGRPILRRVAFHHRALHNRVHTAGAVLINQPNAGRRCHRREAGHS